MCGGLSGDHGSHAVPESSKNNQRNVDKQEERKSQGDKEVKRARGLPTTQQGDRSRKR
jgi:hypothetical protein